MVFSLVLIFRSIIIHACVNVFGFNPFEICSASTVLRFMVFLIKFGKFSTITSLTVFHFCCFLLFFRDSLGTIVIVPQDLKALLIFLLLSNFFLCCPGWLISIVLASSLLILCSFPSILLISLCTDLKKKIPHSYIYLVLKFPVGFLYVSHFFTEMFYLFPKAFCFFFVSNV